MNMLLEVATARSGLMNPWLPSRVVRFVFASVSSFVFSQASVQLHWMRVDGVMVPVSSAATETSGL